MLTYTNIDEKCKKNHHSTVLSPLFSLDLNLFRCVALAGATRDRMGMPERKVVETVSVWLASESMEEDSFVLLAPTYNPYEEPVVVISPKFVAPYPVDLTIVKKVLKLSGGNFLSCDL